MPFRPSVIRSSNAIIAVPKMFSYLDLSPQSLTLLLCSSAASLVRLLLPRRI